MPNSFKVFYISPPPPSSEFLSWRLPQEINFSGLPAYQFTGSFPQPFPTPPRCCPGRLDLTLSLLSLPLSGLSGGKKAAHRHRGGAWAWVCALPLAPGQAFLPGALKSRLPSFCPPFPPIPACPPLCEEFLITTERKIQNPRTNQRRNRHVVGTK